MITPSAIRLQITGSRDFKDEKIIQELLSPFPPENVEIVIHGDARGTDRIAGRIATELFGVDKVKALPANWDLYGIGAGSIRNGQMIRFYRPNRALAFFSNAGNSKGTSDMVWRLVRSKIPTRCYDASEEAHFYATIAVKYPKHWTDLCQKKDVISTGSTQA